MLDVERKENARHVVVEKRTGVGLKAGGIPAPRVLHWTTAQQQLSNKGLQPIQSRPLRSMQTAQQRCSGFGPRLPLACTLSPVCCRGPLPVAR